MESHMQKTKIDALPGTERRPYYFLAEATIVLGYKHPGTVRAKHLSTDADEAKLGKGYYDGRVTLDKKAVHELATQLEKERSTRGEYRLANLGRYAKDLRPHRQKKSLAPDMAGA
jgi:hypothetical protein